MATLQPTSTVTTPSTIGASSPSTSRQRGSTSASVLEQVREPPPSSAGQQKKNKGFLQLMFKNRLSSFASLFWNDQAKHPRESTSGNGSLIAPIGKEGTGNSANNNNNNNASGGGDALVVGRRNRRSSTLSSSSIPMNELSRTSQPDVGEITRLKIPELKDDALVLEIDPSGSLLTDIENSLRTVLGSLESGLVVRSKIRRPGSIEIFALDNAGDNTADAILIVYATEDGRSTDESIAISTNEKLIQNDPGRSHAVSLVITGPTCESKVVYSKRTGKGPQVKISEPFSFFDLTTLSTGSTKPRRISCRTISAMTWANRDILSHLATRARLNTYQLRPTRFLGMGSTAAVCEAELPCQADQSQAEKVAVKTIDNPDVFHREWKILKAVQGYQGLPELILPIPELKTLVTAPVGTPLHRTKIGMFTTGEPFIPVVRGMRGLRARGIVHRDISPGNLIVTTKPDSVDLRLIDLGMAQKFSIHPKPYSGARSFASDKISGFFAARGLSWSDMDVAFGYEDDMESLIKTAVWTLDYQARKIINECAGKKKLEPKDVQRMWARVWVDTKLGQVAYGFLVEHVRAVEPRDHSMVPLDLGVAQQDALHDRVCEWLSNLKVVMA